MPESEHLPELEHLPEPEHLPELEHLPEPEHLPELDTTATDGDGVALATPAPEVGVDVNSPVLGQQPVPTCMPEDFDPPSLPLSDNDSDNGNDNGLTMEMTMDNNNDNGNGQIEAHCEVWRAHSEISQKETVTRMSLPYQAMKLNWNAPPWIPSRPNHQVTLVRDGFVKQTYLQDLEEMGQVDSFQRPWDASDDDSDEEMTMHTIVNNNHQQQQIQQHKQNKIDHYQCRRHYYLYRKNVEDPMNDSMHNYTMEQLELMHSIRGSRTNDNITNLRMHRPIPSELHEQLMDWGQPPTEWFNEFFNEAEHSEEDSDATSEYDSDSDITSP
eukprot:NODE_503_length_1618_cov_184.579987_g363_i0.p1 GENE.NODE_503_length_1618_cov_184.579987_g363_i0~~NODE_503_length_1618_cov_184.579987_g363_i0.p1  ORF type:complete len:327 (-),score=35.13 NODE_503_length_1618_cov_184.579987_g363_i0:313-1293(-)